MPCVFIFPTKWKNQQINMHAARILAKLGHPNVTLVLAPHDPGGHQNDPEDSNE